MRSGNVQPSLDLSEHIEENINAKRVGLYEFNYGTAKWERTGERGLIERYDYSSNPIYVGNAPKGTATSDATWTITQYDLSDPSNASGLVANSTAWDDRASGFYS